ncbi:MAG: Uma2 family endonuclease [Thermodesulfobacteriota bacterium]
MAVRALGADILVPDLAGWRRERFPVADGSNWIGTVPDWAAEILSPGTVRTDRIRKMAIYAREGVPFLWLLDPDARTLEIFRREASSWLLLSVHGDGGTVRAEPFSDIEIDLDLLWLD